MSENPPDPHDDARARLRDQLDRHVRRYDPSDAHDEVRALHVEIDNRFGYHPNITRADGERHEYVRAIVRTTVHELVDHVPDGRERALMITAFDQGLMWANAALARARSLEET